MKKIYLISLAATALLCGCAKELVETVAPANMVPVSISTSASKTTLEGVNVLWAAGDEISIIGSDGKSYSFAINSATGTSSATFSGEMPADVTPAYAMYPKNASATQAEVTTYYTGTSTNSSSAKHQGITGFEIPSVQAPVSGGFSVNPMFGKVVGDAGSYTVEMKNTGFLFKVIIPEGLNDITSVTVSSANGYSLSGTFAVDITNDDVWTVATNWDTQVTLSNGGSVIAPGTYYLSALYHINGNTSDKNIARNSLANSLLKLSKSDGKVSYIRMTGGPAKSARGGIYPIDLTDKAISWMTAETVELNLPGDLPSEFPTGSSSRTTVNTTATVGGHDFIFYSDDAPESPAPDGWYGWYCTTGGNLTGYYSKGSTKVTSYAYLKLPDDFDGKKLREVYFSSTSQNKAMTIVDSLSFDKDKSGASWLVATTYAREPKPVDSSKGICRFVLNQESSAAVTKTRAEGYDYGYYMRLSHSGSFNIIKKITCVYAKEED